MRRPAACHISGICGQEVQLHVVDSLPDCCHRSSSWQRARGQPHAATPAGPASICQPLGSGVLQPAWLSSLAPSASLVQRLSCMHTWQPPQTSATTDTAVCCPGGAGGYRGGSGQGAPLSLCAVPWSHPRIPPSAPPQAGRPLGCRMCAPSHTSCTASAAMQVLVGAACVQHCHMSGVILLSLDEGLWRMSPKLPRIPPVPSLQTSQLQDVPSY